MRKFEVGFPLLWPWCQPQQCVMFLICKSRTYVRCRGTDTNVTRNSLISLVRRTFDLNMCMTMCASRNLNKTKYNCSKTKSLRRKHDNVCLQEFEQNKIQLFKDEKFKGKACLCFKCESLKSGFQRRINSDIKRWRGQMKLKFCGRYVRKIVNRY